MKSSICYGLPSSLLFAFLQMAPAVAQEADPDAALAPEEDSRILGPITVTAQKREQNLQDVGISVSAYSGAQIEALGVTDTTEITEQIPSLQLNAWSPNLTIFSLRGVSQNNFTDNLEAPVAVYLDNAYMGSINGISGQLFDTKRIEVLRGPQGTLFGRNATGGLIHYLSRGADEKESNGYVSGIVGTYNRREVEGAVGGSLSDTVRIRLAAKYAYADGYVKSADTNARLTGSGQDIGGKNGWAARGNLQVDFTPNFSGSFWLKYSQDKDVPTGGYVFANCVFEANGYCNVDDAGVGAGSNGVINGITGEAASPYEHFGEQAGFFNRDTGIYQAEFEYEFANGIDVTSITNFTDLKKSYLEDGDAIPVLVINFSTAVDYKQFSQELRLSGSTDRLEWQTGLYFLNISLDGNITSVGAPVIGAAINNGLPGIDPTVRQSYNIASRNASVFGQLEYDISSNLTLIGGLRYSLDNKSIDYSSTVSEGQVSIPLSSDELFVESVPGINKIDYGDWTARLAIDWNLTENSLLFASYNRGIKGGNWTLASNVNADSFRHKAEVLNSYEVGIKTAIADDKLRLNGTLFLYDYKDYQAFGLTAGPRITNSDAQSTGGEVEVFWSPTEHLNIILGGTFQNSTVGEVKGPGARFGPELFPGAPDVGACTNQGGFFFCDFPQDTISNAKLPNAPDISFNYLFRYDFDALAGNIAFQLDGVYYGEQFLEVTNGRSSLQSAYGLTNLSATWSNGGGFEVQAFYKNVLNVPYAVYSLNLGILGTTQFYGPPATYGLILRKRW